jgi:hypothetical protein
VWSSSVWREWAREEEAEELRKRKTQIAHKQACRHSPFVGDDYPADFRISRLRFAFSRLRFAWVSVTWGSAWG